MRKISRGRPQHGSRLDQSGWRYVLRISEGLTNRPYELMEAQSDCSQKTICRESVSRQSFASTFVRRLFLFKILLAVVAEGYSMQGKILILSFERQQV